MKRIPWVKGNTLNLAVPLQLVTASNGEKTKTDYFPPEGSDIHVRITGRPFGGKEYPYTLTDNVVSFKDDGTLQCGCYGVEITVSESQTEMVDGQKRRTFKQDIEIFNSLDELGTLPDGEIILDAAIFVQGQKGDKGNPFTYEDFTPEQIEELQKPARDAAKEITDDYALLKEDYNTNVKEDYGTNVKDDYATVKQDAQQATSDANDAAQNANDKAGEANSAAQDANDKGTYAKNQGDYAKAKADEIEDAKGTYQTLDARLDAMDAATDDRLEAITTEQLNAIFN